MKLSSKSKLYNRYGKQLWPAKEWFYARADKSGECWEWKNSCHHTDGYGNVLFRGRLQRAHRVSWLLNFGEIPEELIVCHKCDNRKCINPKHLFLGTHQDNALDREKKGRGRILNGEFNHGAVLSDNKVKRILEMLQGNNSQQSIAEIFGVSQVMISRIKLGKNWTHIKRSF